MHLFYINIPTIPIINIKRLSQKSLRIARRHHQQSLLDYYHTRVCSVVQYALKEWKPARYVKQPMKYGMFCKSILTDPYEEIKQEKFRSEKKFIETRYSASLSKTIFWLFFKIMPTIRNAFFHPFGLLF